MLTKAENPALFEHVLKVLKDNTFFSTDLSSLEINEIDDEQLAKIKTLKIEGYPLLTTTFGLNKLVNLEVLSIKGETDEKHFNEALKTSKLLFDGYDYDDLKCDRKLLRDNFFGNQVRGLVNIYALKNLKSLCLENQHYLEEIDFSKLPKLTKLSVKNCPKLEKLVNFDSLECFFDKKPKFYFDFTNCVKLCEFDNLDKILNTLSTQKIDSKSKMLFHSTSYNFMVNNYSGAKELLKNFEETIFFNEMVMNSSHNTYTVSQMETAKDYIDNLVNTICEKDDPKFVQVYKIYNWIINNIKYDNDSLERVEKLTKKEQQKLLNDSLSDVNTIRSSICALWTRKSICSGISNLFNLILSDIGIKTGIVYCSRNSEFEEKSIPEFTISSHQISSIFINEKKYYFDPTFDIGSYPPKYFALNKEEILKNYSLSLYDESIQNGDSLNEYVQKCTICCDKTKQQSDECRNYENKIQEDLSF